MHNLVVPELGHIVAVVVQAGGGKVRVRVVGETLVPVCQFEGFEVAREVDAGMSVLVVLGEGGCPKGGNVKWCSRRSPEEEKGGDQRRTHAPDGQEIVVARGRVCSGRYRQIKDSHLKVEIVRSEGRPPLAEPNGRGVGVCERGGESEES